uniref:Ig-like domain-containing protein n=1 Tax=Sinocyclocheilus rhinocerous TaxID=307959 RepID=A0A673HGC9_9TELE
MTGIACIVIFIERDNAELVCEHNIATSTIILWYKQTQTNHGFILLGYIWNKHNVSEDNFSQKIKLDGDGTKSVLRISDLSLSDSAVYYCAVSNHNRVDFL